MTFPSPASIPPSLALIPILSVGPRFPLPVSKDTKHSQAVPGERSGGGKRKLIADDLDGRRASVGSTPTCKGCLLGLYLADIVVDS